MKRKFTLRSTLKSFLLLSLWLFLRPDAMAQTYCSPTFNLGTGYNYSFNTVSVNSTSFTVPQLASNTTPDGQDFTGSVSFAATSGSPATVTITNTSYGSNTGGAVFVDWNKDGDFNDPGEFIFTFSGSSTIINAITPPVNLPSGNYRMRVLATNSYSPGAGTACADFTSATYLASVNGNGNWMDFILAVTNPFTCYPPDSLTNYALTASTASFVWRASSYTPSQGYRWVVVPGGLLVNSTPVASGGSVGSAPVTVSGLTPSTTYSFYVRSGCSASPTDSSVWVGPLNFTTLGPQCNGIPTTVSITSPNPTYVCYGSSVVLTATDPNTSVSGVTYQWQTSSTRNGVYANVTNGSGGTSLVYTTPAITADSVFYKVVTKCSFTGQTALNPPVIEVINSKYNVPYFEDFSTTANGQVPGCYFKNINPSYSSFSVRNDFASASGVVKPAIRADFPSGTANPASPNNFFTLPGLNLTGGVQYAIRFEYARSNSVYPAYLQLFVNNTQPSTAFVAGSPSVTSTTPLFDKTGPNAITANGWQTGLVTFTPTATGTYYFSWYTNTPEATSITNGTAIGITNINVYVNNACVYPTGQPTAFTSSTTDNSVTGSFTAPSAGANGYLVVRTPGGVSLSANPQHGTTYTAYGSTIGNGTVVFAGHNPPFTDTALLANTTYTYTVFAYNDLCSGGPLYDTVAPLIGTATTIGTGKIYTWNKSVSADFQTATNWTPARYVPDPSDILIFNNSASDTAINLPANVLVSRLQIANNTTVRLKGASGTLTTLTLRSDNDPATNELSINNGSAFMLDDPSAFLQVNFSGVGATAYIAGTMEMVQGPGTTIANVGKLDNFLDLTGAGTITPIIPGYANAVCTVAPTGVLAEGNSAISNDNCINSSYSTLLVYGTINYRYQTGNANAPYANYEQGSTFLISGYTTSGGGPSGGQGQAFYNVTWNCPSETTASGWSGTGPFTVLGTFNMIAGNFQFAAAQNYSYYINNYVQSGGTVDLETGNSGGTLFIAGNFNQTGGILKASNTGTTPATIAFAGTSGAQNVNFSTVPTGSVSYRIMNPNGINLTASGSITNFNINNNSGVRISSGATNPINTTLNLVYSTTNTTLTYDSSAYQAPMTASVFPAANGPVNLTINVGSGNAVTMPTGFTRSIAGALNLTSGDLDANTNIFTVGISGTSTGSITGNGLVRITTGGLQRWYKSGSAPTSASVFPVAYGQANRTVSLFFTNANAINGNGTILVQHTPTSGLTSFTPTTDGGATVNLRTNAYWTLSATNSLTFNASASADLKVTAGYLFSTNNIGGLTLVEATPPIIGTRVAGSGTNPLYAAERSGLTSAQLTGNSFYVGLSVSDTNRVWTAINTGNWNTGSTWDVGVPPAIGNLCVINPNVTVTVAAAGACKSLINNGQLITANTLTVDSALVNNDTVTVNAGSLVVNGGSLGSTNGITNNGLFNVGGSGTVTLGPSGGSNKPFNNGGILNITGGTFNLNGNLNIPANTYFKMSGGLLNVDGNAAGNTANSVASGTSLVSFGTSNINWTSGTIKIIDPHAANTTSSYAFVYSGSIPINEPASDTLQLGNGVSSDAGGSTTAGFYLNAGGTKFAFGTVICEGGDTTTGATGTNRFVALSTQAGILGDLVVKNGAEFRPLGTTCDFNANIWVNTGGFFTSTTLTFGRYFNGSTLYPPTPFQTVNGPGTYRNAVTNAAANFTSINFISATPVFQNWANDSVIFSGTLGFGTTSINTASKVFMNGNIMVERAGAGTSGNSQTNGWVVGTYQKHTNAGGISGTFPIGDSSIYTPITFNATAATTGDIQGSISTSPFAGISGSVLNPTKTIKRVFYIIPVNGLTLNSSAASSATLTYGPGDISTGIIYSRLLVGHDSSTTATGPWTYPNPTNAPITSATNTISLANLPYLQSVYVIGEPCPATTIFTQPVSVNTCSGTNITFTTVATGLTLSYQWQKSVNGAAFADVSGATSATLTILNTTIADTGNYRVVITGICAAPVISNTARLSLTSAATITTQPVSQSVCIGSPVSFSVDTTAQAPATLQWYKDGIPLGVSTTTYTIPATAIADGGNIYAVVTNVCRADTSDTAVLRVNPLPLAFITASGSTAICAGSSVVLTATGGVGYTYQWYMNGGPGVTFQNDTATLAGGYHVTIVDSNGCTATSSDDSVQVLTAPPAGITFLTSPAFCVGGNAMMMVTDTSSDYTYDWLHGSGIGDEFVETMPSNHNFLNTATVTDSFKVVVTNSIGCSDTSGIAYTTANALPVPTIVSTTALSICDGNCDTLQAYPRAAGSSFAWFKDGIQMTPGSPDDSFYVACSSGSYTVQVTNPSGCTALSAATVLSVHPLPTAVATAQGPTTFCQGGNVVLEANDSTGYTYAWYTVFGPNFFGPLSTVASFTATTGGTYRVIVKNASGCADTSDPIIVTIATITANITPANFVSICQGSSANLCDNSPGTVSYAWEYNPGTGWQTYPANTQCINPTAAGQYRVTGTNSTGCSATSNPVTVSVLPVPVATDTAGGPTTFCQGGSVTLCSTSSGLGYTYQWITVFPLANIPGATQSCYTASTTNSYKLVVTNSAGCKDTSTAILVNAVAYPVATINPGGPTSICAGTTVPLTANTGFGYTYQWQVDTGTGYVNISGATSVTYNAGITGNYVVIVTNSTGCATTSAPVSVFVNPLPVIHVSGPTSFCWGSSITLTVDAGTGTGLTYQWYGTDANGVTNPVLGATGPSLFITQPGAKYSVLVSVTNSCSQSSDSVDIVIFPLPAPVITQGADQNLNTGTFVAYQWYKDGQAITGAVASNYDYSQTGDGDYRVLVTDSSGCSGLSPVYHVGATGVTNVNGTDVNVYPNPATTVIHIDAPVKVNVAIVAIDGKVVMQQKDAELIDISKLANGIYTVRVTDQDGTMLKIQKLVKNGN